jgi:hypothetical protein
MLSQLVEPAARVYVLMYYQVSIVWTFRREMLKKAHFSM